MPVAATMALSVALAGTPQANTAGYKVTTIAGLQNLADTAANGLNTLGKIVGSDGATQSFPPCGQANEDAGFIDQKGKITEFVIFSGCYTLARSISNKGIVVGYAAPQSNQIEGFIQTPGGTVTGVTYPGALYTRFTGINPSGSMIVGNEYDGSFHGLIDKGGTLSVYNVPVSATGTSIEGVNDAGDMVGQYYGSGSGTAGFAVIGGTFQTILYPGAADTVVYGINREHVLVGQYTDSSNVTHGFIVTPTGKYRSFDVPGASATSLHGINTRGEVVGAYVKGGTTFAFYAVRN